MRRASAASAPTAQWRIRDIIARLPDEAAALVKRCRSDGIRTGELEQLSDLMVGRIGVLEDLYGSEAMQAGQGRLPGCDPS